MKLFLNKPNNEIKEVIDLIGKKSHIQQVIVEKDMWVSYVLDYLFNRCKYKDFFEFKGGTSLSKGYSVIERFSEDVDIIINSNILGIDINDVLSRDFSKNKKQKMANELNNKALDFYKTTLVPLVSQDLSNELNKQISIRLVENELSIYIDYNSLFNNTNNYILSSVKLEIGPLAAWAPNEKKLIKSYIQEYYPNICSTSDFPVLITLPKRTFWEKAIILHQEANRQDSKVPLRYSRHYYDLYKMFPTQIKIDALNDLSLLEDVRNFTMTFYYRSWSKFEEAVPGSFKLYPNSSHISELEKDFDSMKTMIYDKENPSFSQILSRIRQLEEEINNLERI